MAQPLEPMTTDEMFPDTLVEPFIVSPEVADLALDVAKHWDEFRGLRDALDSEVRPLQVAFVVDTKKFDMAEDEWTVHTVLNVTKASPLWRSLSGYDVVVAYRQVFWDAHQDAERRAFLHHGLSHIDALGGKVSIRPHPVEGFPWTFRRYGPLSLNDSMFLRAGSLWAEDHPTEPTPIRPILTDDQRRRVDKAVRKFRDGIEARDVDVTVTHGGRSATIKGRNEHRVTPEPCPFAGCFLHADHGGDHECNGVAE